MDLETCGNIFVLPIFHELLKAIILMPEFSFKRNFGLNFQTEYQITKIWGSYLSGALCKVKDDMDNIAFIFLVKDEKSGIFRPVTDFPDLLSTYLDLEIKRVERLDFDATNIHYLLELKNGSVFHLKEYTRLSKGLIEITVGQKLSHESIFPKIVSSFVVHPDDFPEHCVYGVFEEFKNQENVDDLAGKTLAALTKTNGNRDDLLNYYGQLMEKTCAQIERFHDIVNSDNYLIAKLSTILPSVEKQMYPRLLRVKSYIVQWFNYQSKLFPMFNGYWISLYLDGLDLLSLAKKHSTIAHGDTWWRQFVFVNNCLYLMDVEDLVFADLEYDFSSHFSGIANQIAYFYLEEDMDKDLMFKLVEKTKVKFERYFLDKSFYQNLALRIISELDYAISHWESNPNLPVNEFEKINDICYALYDFQFPEIPYSLPKNHKKRYFLIDFLVMTLFALIYQKL